MNIGLDLTLGTRFEEGQGWKYLDSTDGFTTRADGLGGNFSISGDMDLEFGVTSEEANLYWEKGAQTLMEELNPQEGNMFIDDVFEYGFGLDPNSVMVTEFDVPELLNPFSSEESQLPATRAEIQMLDFPTTDTSSPGSQQ